MTGSAHSDQIAKTILSPDFDSRVGGARGQCKLMDGINLRYTFRRKEKLDNDLDISYTDTSKGKSPVFTVTREFSIEGRFYPPALFYSVGQVVIVFSYKFPCTFIHAEAYLTVCLQDVENAANCAVGKFAPVCLFNQIVEFRYSGSALLIKGFQDPFLWNPGRKPSPAKPGDTAHSKVSPIFGEGVIMLFDKSFPCRLKVGKSLFEDFNLFINTLQEDLYVGLFHSPNSLSLQLRPEYIRTLSVPQQKNEDRADYFMGEGGECETVNYGGFSHRSQYSQFYLRGIA